MEVLTANVPAGNTDINQEFTVPATTEAMLFFIQDNQAGKDTSVPPSRFHNRNTGNVSIDALQLNDYQIEYGGMTKPPIRINSRFDNTNQQLYQRYINTALESGQFFQLTGTETFEEHCERGPIFLETFMKSADNLATRCHVMANYAPMTSDCRLFLVAQYNRTVKIVRQNGLVVSVQSQNR